MKQKRLKHSADFKAKVAIEALREQSTLSELSTKYGVSQSVISRWETELLNNASSVFGDTPTNNNTIIVAGRIRTLIIKYHYSITMNINCQHSYK